MKQRSVDLETAIGLSSQSIESAYHSPSISWFKPEKERGRSRFEEDERRGSMTLEGSAVRSLFGNGISLDRSRD